MYMYMYIYDVSDLELHLENVSRQYAIELLQGAGYFKKSLKYTIKSLWLTKTSNQFIT